MAELMTKLPTEKKTMNSPLWQLNLIQSVCVFCAHLVAATLYKCIVYSIFQFITAYDKYGYFGWDISLVNKNLHKLTS